MIGLRPRSFSWVLPQRFAVGERPGGSGTTHRRIRREEEICWLKKQNFGAVVSLLPLTHNIQAYNDAGLRAVHVPVDPRHTLAYLPTIFKTFDTLVRLQQAKIFVHTDDVGDYLSGICASYLLYLGLVPNHPSAVATIEAITQRPLGPYGRSIVQMTLPVPQAN